MLQLASFGLTDKMIIMRNETDFYMLGLRSSSTFERHRKGEDCSPLIFTVCLLLHPAVSEQAEGR